MSENQGFFAKILARRIPQFFGIFLAGSWTALEFTSWAVGRYSLSPNWEEVLVIFLLLCLPLILVLAWHHGAPGKQTWSLFEKFFLPLYLLFIPLTLYHIYKDTDLGKTVETVIVQDETGQVQEREIAKTEFIKPLIIYPLKNISANPELDALATISSEVLNRDLHQNTFFSALDVRMVAGDLKAQKQNFKNIPLSFQITYAKKRSRNYLINGTLNQQNNQYQVQLDLYNAKNGRKETSFSSANNNYFSAIDDLSQQINDYFFPNGHEFTDLPIEDLYTNDWTAFNDYIQARLVELFGENKQEAEKYYISSLKKDPTFSMSAFVYALFTLQQQQIVKARSLVKQAQEHQSYRLTEKERFPINATNHLLNQQPEKSIQVLDQWIKLYPNDWQSYLMKANFLQYQINSQEEIVFNFKKVIELDPSQHYLWDLIGDIYNNAGQYDKALEAYENYAEMNPSNPIAYKNLGDLYIKRGNFDSVISNYQQALNIEPNKRTVLVNLADAYARSGNFNEAEKTFLLAIENSHTPKQLIDSKGSFSNFYWQYGKRKESAKILHQAFQEYAQTESQITALQQESLFAWQYYLVGKEKLANEIIESAVNYAQDNKEDILIINTRIGKALLLNRLNKADEALKMYDEIMTIGTAYSDSNASVINHHKGQSYYYLKQYDEALEAFKALDLRFPDNLQYIDWSAKTYLAKQDWTNAEKAYSRLLTLAPAYPTYNLAMAKILIAKDQLPQAKEHLEKALKAWQHADMEFDEIIEAQQLLTSI